MNLIEHVKARSKIVFVDGDCTVCSLSAQFVIKRDQSRSILIASLQSPLGQEACAHIGQDPRDLNTAIFLNEGVFYAKSSAILRIGLHFSFVYRSLARLGLFCPLFIRDNVYYLVAKNRFSLNKRLSCPMPPKEWRDRFI